MKESVFNFGFSDFRLEKTLVYANVLSSVHDEDASDPPKKDVFGIIIQFGNMLIYMLSVIMVAHLYKNLIFTFPNLRIREV